MMLWLLVLVASAAGADYWSNEDNAKNDTSSWVEGLRRRLMRDNYDYQESSSELLLRAEASHSTPEAQYDADQTSPSQDFDDPLLYTTVNSLYVPRANPADNTPRDDQLELVDGNYISRNDLYYANDNMMPEDGQLEDQSQEEPSKNVSYKVIQLPSRRSGGAARFVRERGPGGVALLSLDGAPFPQFRLPAPRRQYQPLDDASSQDLPH